MDKKYIENNIDACLATMSEIIYNFQDEIVDMHRMLNNIHTYIEINEKINNM